MEFGKIYYFVTKVMLYIHGKQLYLSFNVEISNATNILLNVGLGNSTIYSTQYQTRTNNNLSTILVLSITPVVGIVLPTLFVLLIIILIKMRSKHH